MKFRDLYAINVAWECRTIISVVVESNPHNNPAPIRGEAGDLLEVFGDARVVNFGLYRVILAYDDYMLALGNTGDANMTII